MSQTTNTDQVDKALSDSDERAKHRKQEQKSLAVPALLVIIGVLVMLYPVVSTVWNNYGANRAAREYAQLEKKSPQEVKNTQWDNAHAYNKDRNTGPILDPWLNRVDGRDPEYSKYLDQLSATEAMARLVIPSLKIDLPVYHGTEESILQKGLGHLYGSDLPVGGEGTHSVITGHTGLSNATMFDNLRDIKEGDAFFVQVSGHKLKYQVDKIQVVLPSETDSLKPEAGANYITLITCTPYGINTHRFLVRGHQIPISAAEAKLFDQSHGATWQWWMYLLLAAGVLVGLGLGWWLWRQSKLKNGSKEIESENFSDDLTDSDDTNGFDNISDKRGHPDENFDDALEGRQQQENTHNNENNRTWERNDE